MGPCVRRDDPLRIVRGHDCINARLKLVICDSPPRYSDGFLADDVFVRSPPLFCTFERGSAKPGRSMALTGK